MTLYDALPGALTEDYPCCPDDAPRSVVASDVHRALRNQAIVNDASSDAQVPLALFWEALKSGVCRVVDGFFTSTRCYIVTAGVACHAQPALEGRRLEILERLLSGAHQKSIAFDLGLAASTIALNARQGLRSLGVGSKPSRAHPLLMLAARAGRQDGARLTGTLSVVFPNGVSLRCLAVDRPDATLTDLLPPAELAVIRDLVEGRSYREIAARRGTSRRTIANQIGAVFRRKSVSGRNDLVHRLFSESPLQTATNAPPVLPLTAWAS